MGLARVEAACTTYVIASRHRLGYKLSEYHQEVQTKRAAAVLEN